MKLPPEKLQELVEKFGGIVRERPREILVVLCHDHREKTPSLMLYPDGGFYCHGCRIRGHVSEENHLENLLKNYQEARVEMLGQLQMTFEIVE